MLLRYKIPLAGTVILAALVLLVYGVLQVLLAGSFAALEEREFRYRSNQVLDAIGNETDRLASIGADYGIWDDTWAFMQDRNPEYLEQNQTVSGLRELRVHMMLLFDVDGRFVAGTYIDPDRAAELALPAALVSFLEDTPALHTFASPEGRHQGLLPTAAGPLLFATRPVARTNFVGPVLGTILVGTYLDAALLDHLTRLTSLKLQLFPWAADDLPAPARQARDEIGRGTDRTVVRVVDDLALGYVRLDSYTGGPIALVEVATDRAIHQVGTQTLRQVLIAVLCGGALLHLVLFFGLRSQILKRLTRLSTEVAAIAAGGDPGQRTTVQWSDELGEVASRINAMLDALEASGAALREREQQFRLTFESARDAIFWVDPDSLTIRRSNRAATRLAGREAAALAGQPLGTLAAADALTTVCAAIRSPTVVEDGFSVDGEIVRPDGSTRKCRFEGVQVLVEGKSLVQVVVRDLTDQLHAEQERAELEERLRQSQKMEAIGQLAGGVAHDFNNLLAGMIGYADLIRRRFGDVDPKLDRYATVILETGERAAGLSRELLAFARKGKLDPERVDVHRAIGNLARLLERTLERNIVLTLRLDAAEATVMGNETQLQNVFMNLALNARDAMPRGGELRIETAIGTFDEGRPPHGLAPGRYLRVRVVDTGTGMEPAVQARAFEPFYTTKSPGEGTGLGLASAYGTVTSLRGGITIDSRPGAGTAIDVFLPLVAPESDGAVVAASDDLPTGRGNILLVDDEPMLLEVSAELLRDLGYTVACAGDGEQAIDWFREHWRETDLVILDMIMPRLGGRDCFFALRRIDPDARVIIASGYAETEQVRQILAAGAASFLHKPFDLKDLALAVAGGLKDR